MREGSYQQLRGNEATPRGGGVTAGGAFDFSGADGVAAPWGRGVRER